jgi:hypothetical protein
MQNKAEIFATFNRWVLVYQVYATKAMRLLQAGIDKRTQVEKVISK